MDKQECRRLKHILGKPALERSWRTRPEFTMNMVPTLTLGEFVLCRRPSFSLAPDSVRCIEPKPPTKQVTESI